MEMSWLSDEVPGSTVEQTTIAVLCPIASSEVLSAKVNMISIECVRTVLLKGL